MTNFSFWKKISNYSSIVAAIMAIILIFFKIYILKIISAILVVTAIAISMFLIAELMKFTIKNKNR
jgi:hypothetical protein